MDYGEIITRAWNITWKNKFLWVLGFLVALTSTGNSRSSFDRSFDETDAANFFSDPQMVATISALVFALICVFMVIGLIFWLLSMVARGGLIDGVNRIDDGEKVTLGETFSAGISAIWRMIGVYFIAYLPMMLFGLIIAGIVFVTVGSAFAVEAMSQGPEEMMDVIAGSMGLLWMCLCVLICIMIPVGIVLTFITEFASRGTVILQLGIMDSLRHGWNVFKDNLGAVILLWILMGIITFIVSIALGIVMIVPSLIIFAPVIATLVSEGTMSGLNIAWSIAGGLCLGIFGALFMSVIQTWMSAVWTLAYKEFTGKDPEKLPVEKLA